MDHRYFEEQKRVDEVDVLVDAAKELGLDTVAVSFPKPFSTDLTRF